MRKENKTDSNIWKSIRTKIRNKLLCNKVSDKTGDTMKDNGYLKVALGIFGIIIMLPVTVSYAADSPLVKVAGFRSSDYGGPLNGNKYGHDQVDPAYWISVAQRMQTKFPGSSPGAQYVVGYIETPETNTYMPFPAPAGYSGMPNVDFGPTGVEESMLTAFDNAGMKIILQVEPGNANVPKLATMILNKFKQHPSVIGFGVDVEWLRWIGSNKMGSKTNDAEIQTWLDAVHAVNPNYKLLIKHWDPAWLGSGHVSGVTYITDSLNLGSYQGAVDEYVNWANAFSGSEIGYQIGYEEDMNWWLPMSDPAKSLITDIKTRVPSANIYSVYWVDFAITKEFPSVGPGPIDISTVTVISPNGGESELQNSKHNITWTSKNVVGNVKIELLKGTSVSNTITSSTTNTGTYGWTIPSSQTVGMDYKIRVTSTSDSSVTDVSNSTFTIGAAPKSITVTSPNGGESWVRGTNRTIKWTSIGSVGSSVKVELLKGGTLSSTITSSTVNNWSYSWTVPSGQTTGTNYKIRITSTSNSSILDISDNNFTVR
jgi:molybdopterin-binding protein